MLEVETPLLGAATGTDPNLDFFTTFYQNKPQQETFYLQTSPEFAMKRLLAAGSGSIYQICKAFRNGEAGRYHNPEFTLLEWYRVGCDLMQLMAEVEGLLLLVFAGHRKLESVGKVSYESLFKQYTGLNPLVFSCESYTSYAKANGIAEAVNLCGQDHALWLDFLFSHKIQPQLTENTLYMVYGYPACLSSLARVNEHNPLVTERVEVFLDGVELGNGYYELTDAAEQERRFAKEINVRKLTGRPDVSKDERLIAALKSGLPACSGIAIGLDRVLMLLSDSPSIEQVLAFSLSKA